MTSDLHLHTNLSDGTLSPNQILKTITPSTSARIISYTDHHHLTLKKPLDHENITVIPGIEISSVALGHSIHLTGYSLNPKITIRLQTILDQIITGYQTRAKKIYHKIKKAGYQLPPFSTIRNSKLPKPVYSYDIAHELNKILGLKTDKDTINWCKQNGNLLHVKESIFFPDATEVISALHDSGFIAIWAHPGTRFIKDKSDTDFKKVLENLQINKIDGLEAYYPTHKHHQTHYFLQIARQNNLIITGGSDFHGLGRGPSEPIFCLGHKHTIRFIQYLKQF